LDTHWLLESQKLPAAHWESSVQLVRHAVAPQVNGEQAWLTSGGQAPAPSHAAASISLFAVQLAGRQEALASG